MATVCPETYVLCSDPYQVTKSAISAVVARPLQGNEFNPLLQVSVRKGIMKRCISDSDSDNVCEHVACRPVTNAPREELTRVMGERVSEGVRAPAELDSDAGSDHDSPPSTLSHSRSDCANENVIAKCPDGQRAFKLRHVNVLKARGLCQGGQEHSNVAVSVGLGKLRHGIKVREIALQETQALLRRELVSYR